jgi:hypothetical protein
MTNHERHALTLRLPQRDFERLRADAERHRRSVNNLVGWIVADHLDRETLPADVLDRTVDRTGEVRG